ncbi:biotin-dependent carboxyltransferase family protein [Roseovarius sp. EL26]|uniref:5-oxoprolinase subunit C family protein n=1 Tax=Roseovarius sp. EL26 TaxID=2126672 RepID=UPI000EA06E6A|nr:biotin-dependent carboxyltransferase family protein [Roseovarius sp. EL26]
MTDAEIYVSFAGPHVTFQDAGRRGHMRFGVSASGPMDRLSFAAAHAALGNSPGQTAIEISLAGVTLQCREGEVTLAIMGEGFVFDHNGQKGTSGTVLTFRKGEKLSIRPGATGSWAYLAFAGLLQSERWLGHSATHASSGFGGGAIQSGQVLTVHDTSIHNDREGAISQYDHSLNAPIRVVMGPQDQHFAKEALSIFTSNPFAVTGAYDRMGMRLKGPLLALDRALSIPSEPIVRGSVQVSGDGIATVLLSDHQTTGGYPKIATVISCDIDRLVQARSGQQIRFTAVSPEQAISAVRDDSLSRSKYLDKIGEPLGTLEQRLMRNNLIHGEFFQ